MKLYKPIPDEVFRVAITKAGTKPERLTLSDTTLDDCFVILQQLVFNEAHPFKEGLKTTVEVRRGIGKENLESRSFSFYGVEPKKVLELINNYLHVQEYGE